MPSRSFKDFEKLLDELKLFHQYIYELLYRTCKQQSCFSLSHLLDSETSVANLGNLVSVKMSYLVLGYMTGKRCCWCSDNV